MILDIIENIIERCKEGNLSYVYTLEYLLKKMIDPGEEFGSDEKPVLKIDEFKQVFNMVSEEIIN